MSEKGTSSIWRTHGSGMYSLDLPPTSTFKAKAALKKWKLLSKVAAGAILKEAGAAAAAGKSK